MKLLLGSIFSIFIFSASSQSIQFSEILQKDKKKVNFEIIGMVSNDLLVYKFNGRKHRLTIYDDAMKVKDDVNLDFIPRRILSIDFIAYQDHFYAVYQIKEGEYIFCNAAKISSSGAQIGKTKFLDVTYWGAKPLFFNPYSMTSSENKKHILICKVTQEQGIVLSTTLYNDKFIIQNNTNTNLDFDPRATIIGGLLIDDEGSYYFFKETNILRIPLFNVAELYYKKYDQNAVYAAKLPTGDDLAYRYKLKIDNTNNRLIFTSHIYSDQFYTKSGIKLLTLDKENLKIQATNSIYFSDSLKSKLTRTKDDIPSPFFPFQLKNLITKSDKGLLLTLEYELNRWGSYTTNDIIILNLNDSLKLTWEQIINKKQSAGDTDKFLSFSNVIKGDALHYLYLRDKSKEIINNDALLSDGAFDRKPTIKGGEKGFIFMPRLAKQISNNAVIIPGIFRKRIGFAKVILN